MSTPPTTDAYGTMGFEAAMYVGPRGSESPAGMVLADSVRNVSLESTFTEVDVTLRRHKGMNAYQKGLQDMTITFTLPTIKPRTADAALIFNAMRNRRSPIAICILDEEDGEGFIGDFELFGGTNNQEDDDIQNWEITARPAASGKPPKWISGT